MNTSLQGHYRLGSSLSALNSPKEALKAFSVALDCADTDKEMYDTFAQILVVVGQIKGIYLGSGLQTGAAGWQQILKI